MMEGMLKGALLLALIFAAPKLIQAFSDEYRLHSALLANYDPTIRPVPYHNETVRVSLGLALIKILDVDEYKGILEAQYWLRMLWTDNFLKWDPAEYGGLDAVRINIDKIWSPDIWLFNGISESDRKEAMAVVASNGMTLYIPRVTFKTHCDFNLTDNPMETQTCRLKFGSWTYDGFQIDLDFYDDLAAIDKTDFIPHSEWQVGDCDAQRKVKYYPCCEEPYPKLTFNLVMQRKTARFLREGRCN